MKCLLISLSLILICTLSFGQKSDSLQALIQNTTTDTTKAILFSVLADELTKTNPQKSIEAAQAGLTLATRIRFDRGVFENCYSLASALQGQALFDSAILFYRVAEVAALKLQNVSAQAKAYSGLGHSFMRKSNMDSARHYLDKGLVLARSGKSYRIEAGIYNNYGNVYLEESNYQKALDYFIQAAKLYENPLQDAYGQCLALSNIGNVEYRLGNYDKALNYASQSMRLARQESLVPQIGYAHKLLGRIYRQQKKYDSALREYDQARELYIKLGDIRSAAELLQNVGNIYFDQEQHAAALTNYKASLVLAKKISNKSITAYAYSAIGQANYILKNNETALIYLDSARIAAKDLNNAYLLMDTYEAISAALETRGDFKKALSISQQFIRIKDSLTRAENRALMEETQARYELEKKQAQIDLLQKDSELQSLATSRQKVVLIGSVIALILSVVIGVLLINRYRAIARSKRLAEIEAIRNDIARDLHDDIGSTLSTINIMSKLAIRENPTESKTQLSRIAEQSAKTMESMSDIVWSINPVNDSFERVLVKMKVFTAEILEPISIRYQFIETGITDTLILNAGQRKNLFLIFKEAINNSAKYSQATDVEITLHQHAKKLTLTIADNGLGFEVETVNKGNGLANMKTRASELHGEFALTSTSGRGTTVSVQFPIT
jgi:two-component system, NarL family, sensor histidine kinase UhpB